jgi:hypothetical protein
VGAAARRRAAAVSREPARRLVDVDETPVAAREGLDRRFAVEAVRIGGVGVHRVDEDRAADRELGCRAAEHDARDAVAPVATDDLDEGPARSNVVVGLRGAAAPL